MMTSGGSCLPCKCPRSLIVFYVSYVILVYVHMGGGSAQNQRSEEDARCPDLLSTPYSVETESLIETGDRLAVSKPQLITSQPSIVLGFKTNVAILSFPHG